MIVGIDASNIRAGGGVTHLVELLRAASPQAHGFQKVIVWGCTNTLKQIEERPWLAKKPDPLLNAKLLHRIFWQRFRLKKLAKQAGCDILFIPGGSDASGFKPFVTMNQNLLPFEWKELKRYGFSFNTLKFVMLRCTQQRTFLKADGVIYLSQYARDVVLKKIGKAKHKSVIVPHGINPRFFMAPRSQRSHQELSMDQPFRMLYVSIVEPYKHQWYVAKAIAKLRSEGLPVSLDLIGPEGNSVLRLKQTLKQLDPKEEFISYHGIVPYEKLHEFYTSADMGVFASSCETFGQILTESMSAGLPIACSNRSALPEILGDAGIYFDPENPDEIAAVVKKFIFSPELRQISAERAYKKAQTYSWKKCADQTFAFLAATCKQPL